MSQAPLFFSFSLSIVLSFTAADPVIAASADGLYQRHCAECHHAERLGGIGPALFPKNFKRLKKAAAVDVIKNGRVATQMPAFGQQLSDAQIESLVEYVFTPLTKEPKWGAKEIAATQVVYKPESVKGDATTANPVFDADPLNLFLVVESGDHHVTVLDGDKFEPIHRFPSRFALHGGPKYSSDGRFVYFTSRDGWISKFDMYKLEMVAEVRAGINTRNTAVSSDDRYLLVGNYLPNNLVLLDAGDLSLIKIIPAVDSKGKGSRVAAVYDAAPRSSFIASMKDIPEIWEISYDDDPPSSFYGWQHDYRYEFPTQKIDPFPIRRIKLDRILDDFLFDQDYISLIGASREGGGGVVNLDASRVIADLELSGMPHLSSGITWKYKDTTVLATPNLKEGAITIIDMETWKTIKKIKTLGPGFFMRSHENSKYAWTDVFSGPDKDAMHIIDKQSLEIVKTLRPVPGKTSAHVEFTRDGKYALLSIWEMEGALIVYDAKSLKEVKRIPMKKPVGKYNVYNKINRSEGTSH
jgi:mono/diheme cytochrome c family protein